MAKRAASERRRLEKIAAQPDFTDPNTQLELGISLLQDNPQLAARHISDSARNGYAQAWLALSEFASTPGERFVCFSNALNVRVACL